MLGLKHCKYVIHLTHEYSHSVQLTKYSQLSGPKSLYIMLFIFKYNLDNYKITWN